MQYIRRSQSRGAVDFGWLQSRHSFSFGSYYDAKHMGVSVLRVINDDTVAAGKGFETHGHKDMEIISYVTKGAVAHKDSEGNETIIPAGDVQRMSAGSGIRHSEFNPSDSEQTEFFQIWILPKFRGIKPSYAQKSIAQQGALTPLVTPDGRDGSISMNQDATLYRLMLKAGEQQLLSTNDRVGYLHVIKGAIDVGEHQFGAGDAFALGENESYNLLATSDLEALWFDLPAGQ